MVRVHQGSPINYFVMINIFKNKDLFLYISIIFISIFFAISQTTFHVGVEAPLYINGNIKVNQYNSHTVALLNQYSLIIQLITFSLKKGFEDVIVISQILTSIKNFCFFLGIYLTIKSLMIKIFDSLNSRIFCWLITFFIVFVMHLNLGEGDYPVLLGTSPHTWGAMALAVTTLIFGLIANGNLRLSFFLACVFISIHLVHGTWLLGILILTLFVDKYLNNSFYKIKGIYLGLFFGVTVFGLSYFYFYNAYGNISFFKNIEYDKILMNDWMKYWEDHRAIKEINYIYLFKSTLLFIVLLFSLKLCKKYLNRNTSFLLILVAISIALSSIIYILYKSLFNYLPLFIMMPMPTRLLNVHSVIGWPLIIGLSIIYIQLFINKYKFDFLKTCSAVLILLFFININNLKNYYNYFFYFYDSKIGINSFLKNNPLRTQFAMFYHHTFYDNKKNIEDDDFWLKIKKIDDGYYWLVPQKNLTSLAFIANRPVLVVSDMPMYDPSTLIFTKNAIEDLWHISFKDPAGNGKKIENISTYKKKAYEEKDLEMWKIILKKYNVKYITVTNDWNINLPIKLKNSNITVYVIE